MSGYTTALTLLIVGCLGAANAVAGVGTTVVNITVRYSRAELGSPEGAQHLYRRLKNAARQACGDVDGRELKLHVFAVKCYERAIDDAVAKVNEPGLTALHRSRSQRTAAG